MKYPNLKKTLSLVAGVFLLAATLISCAPPAPQAGQDSPAAIAPGEIQRVTLEESKVAFDNEEAVFLDVRSASSYAASHIPGALSIPLAEIDGRIGELDPDQWIITYCT